ncbi:MAG: hypothetical protein Q4A01_03035 [Coriobacteriales bacterium]|nr:hypothetical protein [Coriobacteriales bacterium]
MEKVYTEGDWKLFRKRLAKWQEAHMEKLIAKYVELLQGEGLASEKFWALDKRLRKDKRGMGVVINNIRRIDLPHYLTQLMLEGVIQESDLEGFTDTLRENVQYRVKVLSD